MIWLILAGGVVLRVFLWWENHRLARGAAALVDPAILRNRTLRGGLTSFFFQYFLQAGLFFAVPLFLSVALGLSAIATGVRLLPLSVTLLLAAAGIPKVFPNASPRRVVQIGFLALFAGIVIMVAALDVGAGPEIVTWPMLLAGLGIGALASQLGSVTVSSVPDEQSGEVGGVQNTVTNLGASIGTALAGAVLISALTASFLSGIQNNPAVPKDLASKAQVELAGGIPFMSDKDLQAAARQGRRAPEDRRRDRRRERERPHRRAARVTVAARCHRPDRAVLQPPDPDRAALSSTHQRARSLIIRPGMKAPIRRSAPLEGCCLRPRPRQPPGPVPDPLGPRSQSRTPRPPPWLRRLAVTGLGGCGWRSGRG